MVVLQLSKRSLLICLLPAILLLGIAGSYSMMAAYPLAGKVILIDAGHGGIDPGGNRPGVKEKDLNLALALQLKTVLHASGAKVVLSREADEDLSGKCDNARIKSRYRRDLAARLEMAEESDADIFISIHANTSSNKQRRGVETFYDGKSPSGKALADAIHTQLLKVTQSAPQTEPADFFVLRRNKVPASLIEIGYITNPQEKTLLQSQEHRHKLAEAITQGIIDYFHQPFSLPSSCKE